MTPTIELKVTSFSPPATPLVLCQVFISLRLARTVFTLRPRAPELSARAARAQTKKKKTNTHRQTGRLTPADPLRAHGGVTTLLPLAAQITGGYK